MEFGKKALPVTVNTIIKPKTKVYAQPKANLQLPLVT